MTNSCTKYSFLLWWLIVRWWINWRVGTRNLVWWSIACVLWWWLLWCTIPIGLCLHAGGWKKVFLCFSNLIHVVRYISLNNILSCKQILIVLWRCRRIFSVVWTKDDVKEPKKEYNISSALKQANIHSESSGQDLKFIIS